MRAIFHRYAVPLGTLVVCIVGVALASPYAVSAYHLEAGGRALEQALGVTDLLEWWYLGPREVQDPQALQKAVAHLQQGDASSHALRLLGRAQVARGDVLAGIESLERFTALRPDNRLGHLELAAAYELADQRLHEMEYVRLLDALPGARLSAPDLDGEVAYRPGTWKSDYAYLTTFSLPPDYGEVPTLFLHAGSRVTYTVAPPQPAVLRFGMGLDPRSLGWGSDGATFEVFIDGRWVFLEHLTVEVAREGWEEWEVDLAEYAGQTVQLALATTPGPRWDVTADWAGWGQPQIDAPEAAAYRQEVRGRPWLAEWKKAGMTAQKFVTRGKEAQKSGKGEEAGVWYESAMRMKPEWEELYRLLAQTPTGDAIAVAYLKAGDPKALEKARKVRAGDLYVNYHLWKKAQRSGDLSSAAAYSETLTYFPLEAIHPSDERLLDYAAEVIPALLDEGLWDRDKILNVVSFLVWQHNGAASVKRLLEQMVERYPAEPDWAFYLAELHHRRGELDQAEAIYRQVLALDPNYAQAYLRIGMLYEARAEEETVR